MRSYTYRSIHQLLCTRQKACQVSCPNVKAACCRCSCTSCKWQMEELEAVVDAQRRAVEAAARIANDARDSQSHAVQELQLTLVK